MNVDSLLDEHIGHVTMRNMKLRALETQVTDLPERCKVARSVD